jgi:hypothetical protein
MSRGGTEHGQIDWVSSCGTEDAYVCVVFLKQAKEFIVRRAVPKHQLRTARRLHLIGDEFSDV